MHAWHAKLLVALSSALAAASLAGLVAVQRLSSDRVYPRHGAALAARSSQAGATSEAVPSGGGDRAGATQPRGSERARSAAVPAASSQLSALPRAEGEVARASAESSSASHHGSRASSASAGAVVALRECPDSMRLVGSVVNVARPERSVVAVHLRGGTRVARPGARLGDHELISLGRRRAYLRASDGSLCELRAASAQQTIAAQPAPTAAAPVDSRRAELSPEKLNAAVRQLDAHTFLVSRAVLEQVLGSPALLRRAGRFRPTTTAGGPKGLSLARVSKGSFLTALGLQKGDVLQKLNGHDLSSMDGAIRALRAAQTEGRISVSFSRQGAARAFTYITN